MATRISVSRATNSTEGALHISEPLPEYHGDDVLRRSELHMQADAVRVEEFLRGHLPGGTYDALLGAMLKQKASQFVISYANTEEGS